MSMSMMFKMKSYLKIHTYVAAMVFAAALLPQSSVALVPALENEANKVIDQMNEWGFIFESSGESRINTDTAMTIVHDFKRGHKYFIAVYVENCSSCDLQMKFIDDFTNARQQISPNIIRNSSHTAASYDFTHSGDRKIKIETYVESSTFYKAKVLFFTRSY